MLEIFLIGESRAAIQFGLVCVVCGSAIIWGGAPERAAAAVWLVVFELGRAISDYFFGVGAQRYSVDTLNASRDLLAGVLWIGIALYANRNYTLWIAGFQVLALFGHLSRGLSADMAPIAYSVMTEGPGWLQLSILGIGLIRHIRRKREYGKYRDWRVSPVKVTAGSVARGTSAQPVEWGAPNQGSWRDDLK